MPLLHPIEFTKNLSMPAPWSGELPGETWATEDYFVTFTQNPVWVLTALELVARKPTTQQGFHFEHALHVFSRSSPSALGQGPSLRPVLCVAIARANYATNPLTKGMGAGPTGDGFGPAMLEVYSSSMRMNQGEFPPNQTREAIRTQLFEIWRTRCVFADEPRLVGSLADAWGHPVTGLPTRQAAQGAPASFDPRRQKTSKSWFQRLFS